MPARYLCIRGGLSAWARRVRGRPGRLEHGPRVPQGQEASGQKGHMKAGCRAWPPAIRGGRGQHTHLPQLSGLAPPLFRPSRHQIEPWKPSRRRVHRSEGGPVRRWWTGAALGLRVLRCHARQPSQTLPCTPGWPWLGRAPSSRLAKGTEMLLELLELLSGFCCSSPPNPWTCILPAILQPQTSRPILSQPRSFTCHVTI